MVLKKYRTETNFFKKWMSNSIKRESIFLRNGGKILKMWAPAPLKIIIEKLDTNFLNKLLV